MKGKPNAREKFIQIIQKDPHIIGLITNIKILGIDELTDYGTLILRYYNQKTGIMALVDPAKPTINIHDERTKDSINIPIQLAIRTIEDLYGTPEVIEIPKIHTNLFQFLGTEEPKSFP